MRFKLFPTKEYVFISHCTRSAIITALSQNVTGPGKFVELDFFSFGRIGDRTYFEGEVNDPEFVISYQPAKRYQTPVSGSIGSRFPQIQGSLTDTKDGVEVKVKFRAVGSPLIAFIFFLPVMIILPIIDYKHFVNAEIFFVLFTAIYFIFLVINYYYRIKTDYEYLRKICNAG